MDQELELCFVICCQQLGENRKPGRFSCSEMGVWSTDE